MKDSKLIKLLRTFTEREWKEFEKFTASPYFNTGRNYLPLLKELKKFYPEFESLLLNKEYLYIRLYKDKTYKETVINTMLSGLYNLAEDFLVQQQLDHNPERKSLLLREYTKRKLRSEAKKIIESAGITDPDIINLNKEYYSIAFNAKEILEHYIATDQRSHIPGMTELTYRYFLFDFINQSLTYQNILYLNRKFIKKYSGNISDKITEVINFPKLIEIIENTYEYEALEILSKYYNFAADNSDSTIYYYKLKNLWEKYYNEMTLKLKVSFNISLVNICLKKIAEGDEKFRIEFRDIYKVLLKDGLYYNNIENPVFSNKLFKAIITNSIYLEETGWAEEFLRKYLGKVENEFKDNLYNFSMALIKFKQKKYDESLLFAGKIEQNQIIYKLETKNIISKIYYETNSRESLYSLLDTYKQLILKHEIKNDLFGKSHYEFINALRKITDGGKSNPDSIKVQLEKKKIINSKKWLIEKINELER